MQALTKEAAIRALRRILPEIDLSAESIPGETLNKIIVKMQDFLDVMNEMEPSAMREVFVEVPDVKWDGIGGLEDVKQELKEAVEWLQISDCVCLHRCHTSEGYSLVWSTRYRKDIACKSCQQLKAKLISSVLKVLNYYQNG